MVSPAPQAVKLFPTFPALAPARISTTHLHQHQNAWPSSIGRGGRFATGMGGAVGVRVLSGQRSRQRLTSRTNYMAGTGDACTYGKRVRARMSDSEGGVKRLD
jgi:hypothetical protein